MNNNDLISTLETGSIEVIKKSSAEITARIDDHKINEKEMIFLCQTILKVLPNAAPGIFTIINCIVQKVLNEKTPQTFPTDLIGALKPFLGKKKQDDAIETARQIIQKISPSAFWEFSGDYLGDKNPTLVLNITTFLNEFLTNDEDFKVGKNLNELIKNMTHTNADVRAISFNTTKIVYERKPKTIIKRIKEQIPGDADSIIAKLGSVENKEQVKKRPSAIAPSSSPSDVSKEDIINDLELEFEQHGMSIPPSTKQIKLTELEGKLDSKAEWEERFEAVKQIASICKGSTNKKETANEFKTIVASFLSCAVDARSTLAKEACLDIVVIAEALGKSLDKVSQSIIPYLLAKTNNGAAVIAQSSRLAIVNYVSHVYGKNTKSALIEGYQSKSEEARATIIEAMINATSCWSYDFTPDIVDVIEQAKMDKSEKVRNIANRFEPDADSVASSVSQTSRKSKIPQVTPRTSVKMPMKQQKEEETPAKQQRDEGKTPLKQQRDEGKTPVRKPQDEGKTPVRNQRNEGKTPAKQREEGKAPMKQQRDDGKTPSKQQREEGKTPMRFQKIDGKTPLRNSKDEDKTPLKTPKSVRGGVTPLKQQKPEKEVEEETEPKITFDDAVNDPDTNVLVEFLETQKPDLFGKMQDVIDVLCSEMKYPMPNKALKLVDILLSSYGSCMSSYLSIILDNLSEFPECGVPIINSLSRFFGEDPIALLLYSSKLPYIYPFILNHALRSKDIDTMVRAVLLAIQNDAYESNHGIIIDLLQRIYDQDKDKVEMMFSSIPVEKRKEIFPEIESKMPFVVCLFRN